VSGQTVPIRSRQSVTSWITELPAAWTTQAERLVLYALAFDAPEGIASCGQLVLAQRAGLGVPQVRAALDSLCAPAARRPPLLERLPRTSARGPDRYRLAPGNDRTTSARLLPLTLDRE